MLRYGRPKDEFRFDLVVVDGSGNGATQVEHVPDAWRAGSAWGSGNG
jgi:hypothetical protein